MKMVLRFLILCCFVSFGVFGDTTTSAPDTSSKSSETDAILKFLEEPPLITENLILNATHRNVTIRYKVYLRNALKQEHTLWKIKNEDPKAIGFKITIINIDLDHREDSIEVTRDNCLFKDSIYYFDDGPLIHLGKTLNIEFRKSFTGLGHGFKIDVSSIYEGEESPCPQETDISMDSSTHHIVVRDSLKPEDRVEDYERVWRIQSQDSNAIGFTVTFNKTQMNSWKDMLNISGQECKYEFSYKNYNMKDQSQLPPLEVRGTSMTVYLKLHSLEFHRDTYQDLVFSVDLLYDSNKVECSVCEFANPGDYCDNNLCNCTETHSYCEKFERVCACGEGSVYENGKCRSVYSCDDNNNCISFLGSSKQKGTQKSWNESQAICEEDGGRLVQITTEKFNEYVSTHNSTVGGLYYIGLNENSVNGSYENWMPTSQPVGCPVLLTFTKQWLRVPCDMELSFICEKVAA